MMITEKNNAKLTPLVLGNDTYIADSTADVVTENANEGTDTVQTATLPDMQGSGVVRDLREAASIQSAAGAALAIALAQFAAATTRNGQRAQLDTLLSDWSATAGFPDMATRAAEHGYTLITNISLEHQKLLTLLEIFNGRSLYILPWETSTAQGGVFGMSVGTDANGQPVVSINMSGIQLMFLEQAYKALKESVYDALLLQTRLKPYLDDISLTLDANGNFNLDRMYWDAANDAVFELRRVG